jgi:hypothetical protein
MRSLFRFGSNRADAFPVLERAVHGSDREASKQAMAAMDFVGMPARPQFGLVGEPSPKVMPLLLAILNGSDSELSYFALTSLRAIGFQPQDLPHLADLLAQNHSQSPLPTALDQTHDLKTVQALMANANSQANGQSLMQRYLPEAIAETIAKNPDTIAPYLPPVVDLLDDPDPDVRFGAACALAKYRGVNDPKISTALSTGLASRHDTSRPYPDTEGVKHLMAIETLQRIGPDAQPMIPALLEFARSKTVTDNLLHELAFRAAGHIDSSLRNTIPEVDQALKNDPSQ